MTGGPKTGIPSLFRLLLRAGLGRGHTWMDGEIKSDDGERKNDKMTNTRNL